MKRIPNKANKQRVMVQIKRDSGKIINYSRRLVTLSGTHMYIRYRGLRYELRRGANASHFILLDHPTK